MEIKNTRVTGYIDPEAAKALRVMAAERRVRVTELIRQAIDMFLDAEKRTDPDK